MTQISRATVTTGIWFVLAVYVIQTHIRNLDPGVILFGLNVLENVIYFCSYGNFYGMGYNTGTSPEDIQRQGVYDFIVIGSGPAGSVVANRLSENPQWKVLLLEAGRDEIFLNDIPAYSVISTLTDSNWGYTTVPQKRACWALKDKKCNWPRGKTLGGTSTINSMIYARGSRFDFDEWSDSGNTGWSYEEVLPYFLKSEKIQIPELNESQYHSSTGYLYVENGRFHTELGKAFLDAGEELGYKVLPDYNGPEQIGFSHYQSTMSSGSRSSASKSFLRPIRNRTNLHISLNSKVSKIIVDPITMRATEVEFTKRSVRYRIKSKREIILAAGALNSPHILMHSGIGPKEHLKEVGIPLIKDLKVGHNLQDHVGFIGLTFIVNVTAGILPIIPDLNSIYQYVVHGTGPLTISSAAESLAFVKSKYATDDRPDIELMYVSASINSDNGGLLSQKVVGLRPEFYDELYRSIDNVKVWSVVPIVLRPKSKGVIKLSDNNHDSMPLFNPDVFQDPQDLNVLIEGIKFALEVANTFAFKKFGSTFHNVSIPGCRQYVFASDEYWRCACKYMAFGMNHQVGTCKMGPATDGDAVVDPELRVYGIDGLSVADASIIPMETTGHTMAVAYMIGEKAADLIKARWT